MKDPANIYVRRELDGIYGRLEALEACLADALAHSEKLQAENKRLRDQFRHVDELDWRWIDELLALSSSGNAPFWRHVLRDARAALKGET